MNVPFTLTCPLYVDPTILFAWELGGGLGHMMQMAPLARALVRRGHRVFAALREVAEAEAAFAGTDVCYMEAPHYRPGGRAPAFPVTRNFAHLLANVGWHDERKLFARVRLDFGVCAPLSRYSGRGHG